MNYFERNSMALDEATVRSIAKLARIRIPEAEVSSLAQELSNILEWIEQLNQVDTDDVIPMTSVTDMVMANERTRSQMAITRTKFWQMPQIQRARFLLFPRSLNNV